MLAVPALRSAVKDDHRRGDLMDAATTSFVVCSGADDCGFPDFSDANALLDSIDFDDLFVGMDDGDVLPGLEMDPELLAEFSVSGGEESSDVNSSPSPEKGGDENTDVIVNISVTRREDEEKSSGSVTDLTSATDPDETSSGKNCSIGNNSSSKEARDKNRKSSSQSKNSHGKRKVKVDWTPELHRRFVQAVEQLGVDKAVPSRILELMGIDCLTRHNIASHLQKYRSHRKHLLAREAEAASWTQRRQMYGGAAAGGKRPDMNPWLAPPATRPTMGFPPMAPSQPPPPMHHFRPLHVWGHPSMDPSVMHMWPKHLPHSTSPPQQPVAPPPWGPPPDSPFWHHNRALTPGTPCFPQALPPPTRFGAPHPVPGIPPHAMYKVDPGIGAPGAGQAGPPPRPLFDFQPSKESIDAAIGDVLSKPWQPLPLGLKPPSTDSVMVELQRQGVPKIPPTTTTCA